MNEPSLIEYPCEFPVKIMGHTKAGFAQTVLRSEEHTSELQSH